MRSPIAMFGLLGMLVASPALAGAPADLVSHADFDYYELTLSWSPGFCDTPAGEHSPEQCAAGSRKAFVVHGLWPDNFNRRYPEFCGGDEASPQALESANGVFATTRLAASEYLKHGTCTGLGAENYFAAVKYIRDQITIPEMLRAPTGRLEVAPSEIESAFMSANEHMTAENMSVTCERGELLDVRICVSKSLGAFVDCPKVAGHSCASRSISVSPPR